MAWGHVCSGIRPSTHRGGLGKGSSTQGPSCIPGVPSMGNGADLADSIFWCICFFPQQKSSTSFQVGEWESKTSWGWGRGWWLWREGCGGGGLGALECLEPTQTLSPATLSLGTEDYHLNSECTSDVACPHKCRCEASVVECSSLKLSKIPERIPQSTAEL